MALPVMSVFGQRYCRVIFTARCQSAILIILTIRRCFAFRCQHHCSGTYVVLKQTRVGSTICQSAQNVGGLHHHSELNIERQT